MNAQYIKEPVGDIDKPALLRILQELQGGFFRERAALTLLEKFPQDQEVARSIEQSLNRKWGPHELHTAYYLAKVIGPKAKNLVPKLSDFLNNARAGKNFGDISWNLANDFRYATYAISYIGAVSLMTAFHSDSVTG